MNHQLHRLVFSRRHGMLVAVAEHARAGGKSASGEGSSKNSGGDGRGSASNAGTTSMPWLLSAAVALPLALPGALTVSSAMAQARPPVVFASRLPAPATNLPVPYSNPGSPGSSNTTPRAFVYDASRGSASGDLAASGRVSWNVQGNTATFDQGSVARAVVNWDSFNIGAGNRVHFSQDKDPTKYVSALNRIWSADPTLIFGSLTADREVILLNSNGVYFGRGARVDTGKFVATSLSIADSVFDKGLRNIIDGSAVFSTAGTDYRPTHSDSGVTVEAGAEIRSAAGGDVLLIAPRVANQGRIETPKGQAVLAAGDKVYLMSSSDPKQRGLIVAVDPIKLVGTSTNDPELGIAENAATGSYKTVGGATVPDTMPDNTSGLVTRLNEIRAESGTVNLVGLSVRQKGVINATTAVKGANGAIYLQAMASTVALPGGASSTAAGRRGLTIEVGASARAGAELGVVEIAAGSVTAVQPDRSNATQLDAESFNRSLVRVEGAAIAVAGGARIHAPSGTVELIAARSATNSTVFDTEPTSVAANGDGSRIVIAPDAVLNVSGLRDVALDGARNQGAQRLFRIELADAPVQRSGPLYRSEVFFDLRDASAGKISAANVTGAAAALGRTATERSTPGGTLRIDTEGTVVVGDGAVLDVSGGSVVYSTTTLKNTLLSQGGRVVQFKAADGASRVDDVLANTQSTVVPAYTEGKDGGALTINGRSAAVATSRLAGTVVQGERQRDGTGTRAAPASLSLGRQITNDFFLPSVRLQAGTVPSLDPALFADPVSASLAQLPPGADLSLATVQQGGFGTLALRAGEISQPTFAALDLGLKGTLDARADRIGLNGAFTAAGGTLTLATGRADAAPDGPGDIRLSSATVLDAAGLWTNDSAANTAGARDIQLAGGRVSVAAARSLLLAPGAEVDVSAGARLLAGGSVTRGKAGAITLATGRADAFRSTLQIANTALKGFDFASGGSLTLGAPELTITTGAATGFALVPEFFSAGGFGTVTVDSFGDVRLPSGTQLAPRLLNWQLGASHRNIASGPMSAQVAAPALLNDQLVDRSPVNLAFSASRTLNPSANLPGSSITVERGAGVALEPGANLSFTATRDIQVGASGPVGQSSILSAPGGQITLRTTGVRGVSPNSGAEGDPVGFLADQAIWLGADARLSVSGTAELRPVGNTPVFFRAPGGPAGGTAAGDRTTGTVYGGGTITIDAQRGYVVAAAGSSMALDGAAAAISLPGIAAPTTIAKAGGKLVVSSPEGYLLEGVVSAQAPRSALGQALADGGRIDLSLGTGGVASRTAGNAYPVTASTPRQVLVGASTNLLGSSQPGTDLNAALGNGIGYTPTALLQSAGFDGVRLAAGDRVVFDANLTLAKGLGISLDTPVVTARPGSTVSLSASAITLGDNSLPTSRRSPADTLATRDSSANGTTRLTLQAPLIEVVGNSALQGFSQVKLDAAAQGSGEIRLLGPTLGSTVFRAEATVGSLNFAGALELGASQVYATSGTSFTFTGLPATGLADPGSSFVVRAPATATLPATPLSAFGALSVSATQIDQGGVLRQPFGAIDLQAGRVLRLGDNSLTSVAGSGPLQLFGQTDNLSRWLLPTGEAATALPRAKGVTLGAASVDTAASAKVDGRGGGDVQAWEFFPGVGGSSDYFLNTDLYAVLPDYRDTHALPFDGRLDAAGQGRQIVITLPGSGLAPGRYNLLPARFALMGGALPQGSYLVRRASDQGKTALAAAIPQDDGSTIVSGYFSEAGSITAGVPGERFLVEPEATFRARSETRLSSISDLLASQNSVAGNKPLPRDGALIQVVTTGTGTSLWRAGLALGAQGGAAGLLDLSANRLALVDDLAKTPGGTLGVSADVIEQSGAGSVLLGGRRTAATTAAGAPPVWRIDQSQTNSVTVDLGQQVLDVEELVLAASGSVALAPGTRVAASRPATLGERTLSSVGDGAIAVVSTNAIGLQRTGAALAGGDLSVGAGSVLSGPQLSLDATGLLGLNRSASLQNNALSLGARRIVVGDGAAADPLATVLAGDLLSAVRRVPALTLQGYASIDFAGQQNWADRAVATVANPNPPAATVRERLVLDAPVVRGLDTVAGVAASTDIAAQSVQVRNTTGQTANPALTGQGTLVLQALPPLRYGETGGLALGPGAVSLGFDNAHLRSGGDVVLQGTGSTRAQGNLTVAGARLTATNAADQALQADAGVLTVASEAASRSLGERVGQGARVALTGQTVRQLGAVDLAAGILTVTASGSANQTGAVTFGAGSTTSVAGFTLTGSDGAQAFVPAGSISATAQQGGMDVLGTLNVAAARRADGTPGLGDAGRVDLKATGTGGNVVLSRIDANGVVGNGVLVGNSGSGTSDLGGSLAVDVSSVADLDALARAASVGGLNHAFAVRARSGNLALGTEVTARRITISADAGSVTVGAARLDARAPSGGVVQLAARDDVVLAAGSRIDAASTRAGANGGDVLLASTSGRVRLASNAVIAAGGDDAPDGRIVLRARRGTNNTSVQVDALNTANLQAGEVDVEAVRVYSTVTVGTETRNIAAIATGNSVLTGSGATRSGTLGQTSVRTDSTTFMNAAPGIRNQLGITAADAGRVSLRAGVEVRAANALNVSADWALNAERPGGDAGFLTLRAAGNLTLNGSLSDGFTTATSAGVLNNNTASWSLRLAAGADLTAASPTAVQDLQNAAPDTGNLLVSAGRLARTGAGSIDLAAGRDIRFAAGSGSTAPGLAYVAGRRMGNEAAVLTSLFATQTAKPTFTEQGGRLTVQANRDITSPEATQLINNWFWRSGLQSTRPGEEALYNAGSQLAWWSEFGRFRQTLGSFGGGDVLVQAGRDIVNVQAMAPTTGWADSRVMADAVLQQRNGGDVTVRAGRNVAGGQYFAGGGDGRITAGGSVIAATSNTGVQEPVLALMDSNWRVAASGSVRVAGGFNPTAMSTPNSSLNGLRQAPSGFFYTWGDDAALNLVATSGDLILAGLASSRIAGYGLVGDTVDYARVLPANLTATAAGANLNLLGQGAVGGALLFPSANSQLQLWADGDLTLGGTLSMADSDIALWPSKNRPVTFRTGDVGALNGGNGLIAATINDVLPRTGLHANDAEPVRIHAEGSIRSLNGALVLAKQARLWAGEDVVDLQLAGQNLASGDFTSVVAGRDIVQVLTAGKIEVGGPGALEVTAGRNLDLGASKGVRTFGNLQNANLPAAGASIRLMAANAGVLDVAAFEAAYLSPVTPAANGGNPRAATYRDLLLANVRQTLRQPALTYDEALAQFRTFPAVAQAELGRLVQAAEFGAVYLTGRPPTVAQVTDTLRLGFEQRKEQLLQAGQAALLAGLSLTLPGREVLQGSALAAYLGEIRALGFASLNLDQPVATRVASLQQIGSGWQDTVARSLGTTVDALNALATQSPQDPAVLAYRAALADFSGRRFEAYRNEALAREIASAGAAASLFGRKSLPMRLALFDQGFQAAELAGAGSFVGQPAWPGATPVFDYTGTLNMTQSSVLTERGGDISLLNAGGAINVGLKESTTGISAGKGVIALGGGDVFGYAQSDFQVNNQRVFVVGRGNMDLWSSIGDIDSGRGANTAVAAPPLAARRSVDGVVFELPATTTGSGLGILEDTAGNRQGSIGLYPAFGEILALDAFIRAPSVILGSTIRGADNLQSASVGGAAAPVSAPALAVAPPSSTPAENRASSSQTSTRQSEEARQRNSLLTVDLLGLGPAPADEECSEQDRIANKCPKPVL